MSRTNKTGPTFTFKTHYMTMSNYMTNSVYFSVKIGTEYCTFNIQNGM